MSEAITYEQLVAMGFDANSWEEYWEGTVTDKVVTRLGKEYPTHERTLQIMIENGLYRGTMYSTKIALDAALSSHTNLDYAIVTDDKENDLPTNFNGFYQKQAGIWVYLAWNPLQQFLIKLQQAIAESKQYTDAEIAELSANISILLVAIQDAAALDATNKANQALNDSKSYTDAQNVIVLTQASDDATNKANQAVLDANQYTRTETDNALDTASIDASEKADQAFTDAKQYADLKDIEVLEEANQKLSEAIEPINEFKAHTENNIVINMIHDSKGNKYAFAIMNKLKSKIGFGLTEKLKMVWLDREVNLSRIGGYSDRLGRHAIAVKKSGKVYIPDLVLSQISLISGLLKVGLAQSSTVGFRDKSGRYALAVKKNGSVVIPGLKLSKAQVDAINSEIVFPDFTNATSIQYALKPSSNTIYHIAGYGQSLSIGSTSIPPISTSQPFGNLMFASGVAKSIGNTGYDPSVLIPLIEQVQSHLSANHGETPTAGLVNGLSKRIDNLGFDLSDFTFLGTQSGVDGNSIEQLTVNRYNRLEAHLRDANTAIKALSKSHNVPALTWIQGEADTSNTPYMLSSTYMEKLTHLIVKMQNSVLSVTKQSNLPLIFMYQTNCNSRYSLRTVRVPTAQWLVAQRPDVVMATPVYCLPHTANNVHLNNEGSWLLGQYIARAMFHTLVLGKKWRPLEPVSVNWTSTHIDIKYHVPVKPLQLSNLIVNQQVNEGFDLWDVTDTENPNGTLVDAITNVTILDDAETVRLTLDPAVTIPAKTVLRYGGGRNGDSTWSGPTNGARGNVMDSNGLYDTVTSPTNIEYPMYNHAVFFEYNRQYGFMSY